MSSCFGSPFSSTLPASMNISWLYMVSCSLFFVIQTIDAFGRYSETFDRLQAIPWPKSSDSSQVRSIFGLDITALQQTTSFLASLSMFLPSKVVQELRNSIMASSVVCYEQFYSICDTLMLSRLLSWIDRFSKGLSAIDIFEFQSTSLFILESMAGLKYNCLSL